MKSFHSPPPPSGKMVMESDLVCVYANTRPIATTAAVSVGFFGRASTSSGNITC